MAAKKSPTKIFFAHKFDGLDVFFDEIDENGDFKLHNFPYLGNYTGYVTHYVRLLEFISISAEDIRALLL